MPKLASTVERTTIRRLIHEAVESTERGATPGGAMLGLMTLILGLYARYPNDAIRLFDQVRADLVAMCPEAGEHLTDAVNKVHDWLSGQDVAGPRAWADDD